jgi:hypothetical protein
MDSSATEQRAALYEEGYRTYEERLRPSCRFPSHGFRNTDWSD